MKYVPSINICLNSFSDINYVITENSRMTAGSLIEGYNSGYHSFSIIGNYGTGKSSFLLALEHDLKQNTGRLIHTNAIGNFSSVEFINIIGDYTSLESLLKNTFLEGEGDTLTCFEAYLKRLKTRNQFLFIIIDEFGKVLEYSAKHDPERELFFLQKFCEIINVPASNVMLLTTLHQNFGSYATKLSPSQRNEWLKIKGRFREIVFAEPIEQQLYVLSSQLNKQECPSPKKASERLLKILEIGKDKKLLSANLSPEVAVSLFPLDPLSAVCLLQIFQQYGQNERSLFSFLTAPDSYAFPKISSETSLYNLANVYDYSVYHFYSTIREPNSDTMGWNALSLAIEKIKGFELDDVLISDCLKLVKVIGLLNIFFKTGHVDADFLIAYGINALTMKDSSAVMKILESRKVIRYAKYKSQYILYEGTNIDIEAELYKAASVIPKPLLTAEELGLYVNERAAFASAATYQTGTPRYFEYCIYNNPLSLDPTEDIDGYIQLILPLSEGNGEESVVEYSLRADAGAIIFGYYNNVDKISSLFYEIKKIQYVIENIALDDRVAKTELEKQKSFAVLQLRNCLQLSDESFLGAINWYYRGVKQDLHSIRDFNKLLSKVCEDFYYKTPIIKNELFNRERLSSAISLARVNLLNAMINHHDKRDFGIDSFPPEKTIYYTMFKESGMHRRDEDGHWILTSPYPDSGICSLWEASVDFINQGKDKPVKISQLRTLLSRAPYKVKRGVLDFWIPIFIFVNRDNIALYNGNTFVINVNKEALELVHKRPYDFSIRSYELEGARLDFFKKYRRFLSKDEMVGVNSSSLLETIKPFFQYYRNLHNYAKQTKKFDNPFTIKFREAIAKAQDPVKAFFEDLPQAFGYREDNNEDFINSYVGMIRTAVKELNESYDRLLDRIEEKITDYLGLPRDFSEYKLIIERRYASIDPLILTPKSRAFLERVLTPSLSKREFIEKISIIINDKRLEEIRDSEEMLLINQLLHMFGELEKQSSLNSNDPSDESEAFVFEMASSLGDYSPSKTYRLPKNKIQEAEKIIGEIKSLLSSDENFNISLLLKLLNEKLK